MTGSNLTVVPICDVVGTAEPKTLGVVVVVCGAPNVVVGLDPNIDVV